MSNEQDNVVDLAAFREQKEKEEAEKLRLEKEAEELEEVEQLRYLLNNIMEQLGDPSKTGSLFYVPMSDEDYFNRYTFESGYNKDGYYESTWTSDDINDHLGYFNEEDEEEDDDL